QAVVDLECAAGAGSERHVFGIGGAEFQAALVLQRKRTSPGDCRIEDRLRAVLYGHRTRSADRAVEGHDAGVVTQGSTDPNAQVTPLSAEQTATGHEPPP